MVAHMVPDGPINGELFQAYVTEEAETLRHRGYTPAGPLPCGVGAISADERYARLAARHTDVRGRHDAPGAASAGELCGRGLAEGRTSGERRKVAAAAMSDGRDIAPRRIRRTLKGSRTRSRPRRGPSGRGTRLRPVHPGTSRWPTTGREPSSSSFLRNGLSVRSDSTLAHDRLPARDVGRKARARFLRRAADLRSVSTLLALEAAASSPGSCMPRRRSSCSAARGSASPRLATCACICPPTSSPVSASTARIAAPPIGSAQRCGRPRRFSRGCAAASRITATTAPPKPSSNASRACQRSRRTRTTAATISTLRRNAISSRQREGASARTWAVSGMRLPSFPAPVAPEPLPLAASTRSRECNALGDERIAPSSVVAWVIGPAW